MLFLEDGPDVENTNNSKREHSDLEVIILKYFVAWSTFSYKMYLYNHLLKSPKKVLLEKTNKCLWSSQPFFCFDVFLLNCSLIT